MAIEPDDTPARGLGEFCAQAIAGGVDIVRLDGATPETAAETAEVCRREDALFIVGEDASLAASVEADGVHFGSSDASMGLARAVLGIDAIVGLGVSTLDEARLALEVGGDYLVHGGGTACPGVFASLGGTGSPLFAGGITGIDDAARIVAGGVYRLCIGASLVSEEDVTEDAAAYARLLGRCI